MKTIKTYSTRLEADVAKIVLAGEDIPSWVVGIGSELEGGSAGVQLQVTDERALAALKVLRGS